MAYIGNEVTQSKFTSIEYTATAAQTTFPSSGALPETAANKAAAIVKVNGLVSHTGSYEIGTTLVFDAGLDVGDMVEIVWLGLSAQNVGTLPANNTVTTAHLSRAGTSGQVLTSTGSGSDATWSAAASRHASLAVSGATTITSANMADCDRLFVHVNAAGAGANYDVTLPAVGDFTSKMITVICTTASGSYDVSVVTSAGGEILNDGGAIAGLDSTYDYADVYSDGTSYIALGFFGSAGGGGSL